MKVDDSILKSVRSTVVGVEDNLEFDNELIPYINSSIFNLNQNGVGANIIVDSEEQTWGDLMGHMQLEKAQHFKSVPLYIALNTQLLFDPPPPSNVQYHDKTITEMLWRLKIEFEEEEEPKNDPARRFTRAPWRDAYQR